MAHYVLLQVFDGRLRQHQRRLQHPVRQRHKIEHLRVRGACIMTGAGTECRRRQKGYWVAWRSVITAVSPRLDGSSCACIPHTPPGRQRVERRAKLGRLGRVGRAVLRGARVTGAPESERTWWRPRTGVMKHSAIASATLPSCTMLPAPKPRGAHAAALMLDDIGARGAIACPTGATLSAQTQGRGFNDGPKTKKNIHQFIFKRSSTFIAEGAVLTPISHCKFRSLAYL